MLLPRISTGKPAAGFYCEIVPTQLKRSQLLTAQLSVSRINSMTRNTQLFVFITLCWTVLWGHFVFECLWRNTFEPMWLHILYEIWLMKSGIVLTATNNSRWLNFSSVERNVQTLSLETMRLWTSLRLLLRWVLQQFFVTVAQSHGFPALLSEADTLKVWSSYD